MRVIARLWHESGGGAAVRTTTVRPIMTGTLVLRVAPPPSPNANESTCRRECMHESRKCGHERPSRKSRDGAVQLLNSNPPGRAGNLKQSLKVTMLRVAKRQGERDRQLGHRGVEAHPVGALAERRAVAAVHELPAGGLRRGGREHEREKLDVRPHVVSLCTGRG